MVYPLHSSNLKRLPELGKSPHAHYAGSLPDCSRPAKYLPIPKASAEYRAVCYRARPQVKDRATAVISQLTMNTLGFGRRSAAALKDVVGLPLGKGSLYKPLQISVDSTVTWRV
ncbi:unnamed protein product [Echinostoma caproni]|uniref:Complex I-B9 n=1 Tax=Echinostoma caproni TaxID=27848 RepID=A0A183AD71_9TREM|nr:unnamed protein product [Echinostoma caproni]